MLNFEIPEENVNNELDELIKECLSLDMRGLPVDTLFEIKILRDQYIRKLLDDRYDYSNEEKNELAFNPLKFFMKTNEMWKNINKNLLVSMDITENN